MPMSRNQVRTFSLLPLRERAHRMLALDGEISHLRSRMEEMVTVDLALRVLADFPGADELHFNVDNEDDRITVVRCVDMDGAEIPVPAATADFIAAQLGVLADLRPRSWMVREHQLDEGLFNPLFVRMFTLHVLFELFTEREWSALRRYRAGEPVNQIVREEKISRPLLSTIVKIAGIPRRPAAGRPAPKETQ